MVFEQEAGAGLISCFPPSPNENRILCGQSGSNPDDRPHLHKKDPKVLFLYPLILWRQDRDSHVSSVCSVVHECVSSLGRRLESRSCFLGPTVVPRTCRGIPMEAGRRGPYYNRILLLLVAGELNRTSMAPAEGNLSRPLDPSGLALRRSGPGHRRPHRAWPATSFGFFSKKSIYDDVFCPIN